MGSWFKKTSHALALCIVLALFDWAGLFEFKATSLAIAIGLAALIRNYEVRP